MSEEEFRTGFGISIENYFLQKNFFVHTKRNDGTNILLTESDHQSNVFKNEALDFKKKSKKSSKRGNNIVKRWPTCILKF